MNVLFVLSTCFSTSPCSGFLPEHQLREEVSTFSPRAFLPLVLSSTPIQDKVEEDVYEYRTRTIIPAARGDLVGLALPVRKQSCRRQARSVLLLSRLSMHTLRKALLEFVCVR